MPPVSALSPDSPVVHLPRPLLSHAWGAVLAPLPPDLIECLSALPPFLTPPSLGEALDRAHLDHRSQPCTIPPRRVTSVACRVFHTPPTWLLEEDVPRPKRQRSVPPRPPRFTSADAFPILVSLFHPVAQDDDER